MCTRYSFVAYSFFYLDTGLFFEDNVWVNLAVGIYYFLVVINRLVWPLGT